MQPLASKRGKKAIVSAHRVSALIATYLLSLLVFASAARGQNPFIGIDVGVSEPVNDHYRTVVNTGVTANPYGGYMFNDYLGLQGQFHFVFNEAEHSSFIYTEGQPNLPEEDETHTTVLFGGTFGPRLAYPFGDLGEVYATGQGGFFTGLRGQVDGTGAGVSAGAGLDYYLTPQVALTAFGRWNRAFMDAESNITGVELSEDPEDPQWATAGLGVKYRFTSPPPPPPPPIAAAPPPPPPPPPPAKKRIVLRNVHFDFDKAEIRADAAPVLDEAAETLRNLGPVLIVVEGHTDSVGSEEYNQKLSQRRAQAVRRYLTDRGIAPDRLRAEGQGESRPVASNDTVDGRAQNRRVELRLR